VRKKTAGWGRVRQLSRDVLVVVVWPPERAPTRSYPAASVDEEKIRPRST
jgi:hypothetical protein